MTYREMIDAVNDAATEDEHRIAQARLDGAREVIGWSGIADDNHTMSRFGEDRPMCCGVLLDWREQA